MALAAVVMLGGVQGLVLTSPAEAAFAKAGTCTIVGTAGDDVLRGTAGDDVICGLGGDDKIVGRGGDDVLRGGGGADVVRGGPGDDRVSGGRGEDRVFGQAGDDVVRGDAGADEVVGGAGNDRLGGFRGADVVKADGDPGGYVDDVRCGPGPDTVSADPADRVRPDCETVAQNDPPSDIALAPSTIAENEPPGSAIGLLKAVDPDAGDSHAFTLVPGAGSAGNALVRIDGAGLESDAVYDFEAESSFSIRVRATDDAGESIEKAFVVTVTDVNDDPVVVDDDAEATEDTQLDLPDSGAGSPAANDTDQDGDALTVSAVSNPSGGTVSISGGQIHFEPEADLCGNDAGSFTYTVSDGAGGTDAGTVTVDIACVDDLPTAVDDDRTVDEDDGATPLTVLTNDTDPESDAITVTGASDPANGSTTFTAADVSYTPDADYCNSPPPYDTFTYTVNGGDTATVRVTVTCDNDAPVAVDDHRTTDEDVPLENPVTGAGSPAADDDDVEGDTLTVTAVSDPVGGTVNIAAGQITFTPTANLCGASQGSYDYTVSDGNGGTDTGTVTIDLTCVDDPSVANDDSRTVDEDSGATTFGTLLGNDTDVESDPITITGASDPANGATTFTAADVTYTPDPDFCGDDSFTYTVNGGDTATVSVTVTCVNDAPVVDLDTTAAGNGSTATFSESDPHAGDGVLISPDAGVTDADDANLEGATITLTDRPDGDAGESLSFTAPGGSGITGGYTPATGVLALTGTASKADYAAALASVRYDNTVNPPTTTDRTVTVVVTDGDLSSVSRTATVVVNRLNVPPVNTVPGPVDVTEDVPFAFTGSESISVADADGTDLTVQVTATHGVFTLSGTTNLTVTGNGTASVSLSGPIADLNAALDGATYTPAANYVGAAQITVETSDGSAADTDSVDITVTPVNDPPTATNLSAAESYTEDTSKNLVDIVVSDVDSANVTVTLTLSSPSVGSLSTATSGSVTSTFSAGVWTAAGPIASVNALLADVVFTPAANVDSAFTIATSVSDGVASPATGSKTMTGVGVNDAPTSAAPASVTTDEDVAKAVNGMSVADVDNGSLSVTLSVTHGTLSLTGTSGLTFMVGDGAADATMEFEGSLASINSAIAPVTYTPAADYFGPAVLTFTVSDGAAPAVTKTLDITVNAVNDAPVADDETFDGVNAAIGNTALVVDDPTDGAPADPAGPQKSITGDILAGDTDVDSPSLSVVPGTTASGGGTVTMEADGDFTVIPPAGCAASYSFDYTVTDGDMTDVGTVTVALTECVWYVDASVPTTGDGRSHSPLKDLSTLNGVGGAGDVDGADDYLFLYGGGTFSTGIILEAGQRLFGQPQGLTVDGTALEAATGTRPNLHTATVGAAGITLANGSVVRGVNAGQVGTASSFGIRGVGVTTSTIGDNVDIAGNSIGFGLQGAAGGDVLVAATISGNTGASVSVQQRTSGTVTVSGNVTASGPNSTVEAVNNAGATIALTGKLDLSGANLTALDLRQGGTVTVTNAASTITGVSGLAATAVNLDGVTIGAGGLALSTVSTAVGGAANGIVVNNVTGTGAISVGGGTLTTSTRGLDVNGGTGNVTVGNTFEPTAGRSVEVTGHTSGTIDVNGPVNEDATGVNLTGNTGATVRFDGGVTASTGTSTAFNATGGGTVVVTDPNGNGSAPDNTLSSSGSAALNVQNTSIGADGLTFRSISAGNNTAAADPASGIVLNATGSSGGLQVTGDGGGSNNGSGGSVQNTTSHGITLTSTVDVDLGYLNVTNSGDSGIKAINVTDFRLNRSNVNSNGNSTADEGVQLGEFSGATVGATGVVSILNSSISGNAHNNFHLRNTSGTISSFTVSGSSFNNLNDTFGANAFLFEGSGTSVTTAATISGSTFQNNSPQRALEVQVHDTGTIGSGANAFSVSGNAFVDNGIHASFTQDTAGSLQFKFQNNGTAGTPMTGSILQAVNVFSSSQSTGGTLVGTISGNVIGNAAVAGSGSTQGGAISAVIQGQTDATLLIDSNTTRQTSGDSRAIAVAFRGPADPLAAGLGSNTVTSDLTITNNNVVPGAAPSGFPLAAIVIEADNQTGADNKSPTVRADVRGNFVPSSSVFDFLDAQLIYYEYTSPGSHGIGQLVDTAPASANATAQLQSTNTGTAAAGEGPADVALIAGPVSTPP